MAEARKKRQRGSAIEQEGGLAWAKGIAPPKLITLLQQDTDLVLEFKDGKAIPVLGYMLSWSSQPLVRAMFRCFPPFRCFPTRSVKIEEACLQLIKHALLTFAPFDSFNCEAGTGSCIS